MKAQRQPSLVFLWGQFGPYHVDRCRAVAHAFGAVRSVIGMEFVATSEYYKWSPTGTEVDFKKITLFPETPYDDTRVVQRISRLVACCVRVRAREVFLIGHNPGEFALAAAVLRLLGRRVYLMQDSKFDDKPRRLWIELFKKLLYLPYCGALVSGPRTRAYLRFLGCPDRCLAESYDTLSIQRIRRLAGMEPAPGGTPYADRHFTAIARFLPKKNLGLLIDAYAIYRDRAGRAARDLVLCGSGPLEADLKERAKGIGGIRFTGFLQEGEIARVLSASLALVLPSVEEQWGLVVNEAFAMGVPALVSDNVGARDTLVRTAVNGYVFEPDNAEGLSFLLERLATDEEEWRRLSAAALDRAPQGDVARFVEGVGSLTGLGVGRPTAQGDSDI